MSYLLILLKIILISQAGDVYGKPHPSQPESYPAAKTIISENALPGNELKAEGKSLQEALPAFPGAEGFGRYAEGGRGGDVYYVTHLEDSGPGSFRHGIETADGPRTIMFKVSGTIFLKSNLVVNKPHITIAGQSAPGDGITLANAGFYVAADHIIVRFIRVRMGDLEEGRFSQNVRIASGRNIILDHVTASWGINETLSTSSPAYYGDSDDTDIDSVTVQWSMITESLYDSYDPKGRRAYGGVVRGRRETHHHNLYAHHNNRSPKIAWRAHSKVDFRNNVVYNAGNGANYDGANSHVNWANNYYKPGPNTGSPDPYVIFAIYDREPDPRIPDPENHSMIPQFYIDGNYVEGYPVITEDNWRGVTLSDRENLGTQLQDARVDQPFDYPQISYERTAQEAYEAVLERAGASLVRDAIDNRIVAEVRYGTATYGGARGAGSGIIDSQEDVGGWPELRSTEPPVDSDGDGLPDWWKTEHGLQVGDPEEGKRDRNGDGYTNLEEYLDWLANHRGRFLDRHPSQGISPYIPGPVELVYPGERMMGVELQPVFLWQAEQDAATYQLEILDSMMEIILDTVVNVTEFETPFELNPLRLYNWRVRGINASGGKGLWSNLYWFMTRNETSSETNGEIPERYRLLPAYPNPFNHMAVIRYEMPENGYVELKAFDHGGREITILQHGAQQAGFHQALFDAASLASGVYLIRLEVTPAGVLAGQRFVDSQKITLIK